MIAAMPSKLWPTYEANDNAESGCVDKFAILDWRVTVNPAYLPCQMDSNSFDIFSIYMTDYLERGTRPDFDSSDVEKVRMRAILTLLRS